MKVREIITYKTISMISSNANRKRSGIKSLRYFADFGVAFFCCMVVTDTAAR